MSLRLFTLAIESPETPPEVVDWFITALREHLRTGTSMDALLGLRGEKNGRKLRTTYRIRKRNLHLLEAWRLCGRPKSEKGWRYLTRKVRECFESQNFTDLPSALAEAINNAGDAGLPTNWKVWKEAVISATVEQVGEQTRPQNDMRKYISELKTGT